MAQAIRIPPVAQGRGVDIGHIRPGGHDPGKVSKEAVGIGLFHPLLIRRFVPVGALPAPIVPGHVQFVVPTEERQAGMCRDPGHLLLDLCRGVRTIGLIIPRHPVGELEVLPDQDAGRVAGVQEGLGRVHPTGPHAHHVHVGPLHVAHQPHPSAVAGAGKQQVRRHQVGALHEGGPAVHHKGEGRTDAVRALVQLNAAEADVRTPAVQETVSMLQQYLHLQQVLFTGPVGLPAVRAHQRVHQHERVGAWLQGFH